MDKPCDATGQKWLKMTISRDDKYDSVCWGFTTENVCSFYCNISTMDQDNSTQTWGSCVFFGGDIF